MSHALIVNVRECSLPFNSNSARSVVHSLIILTKPLSPYKRQVIFKTLDSVSANKSLFTNIPLGSLCSSPLVQINQGQIGNLVDFNLNEHCGDTIQSTLSASCGPMSSKNVLLGSQLGLDIWQTKPSIINIDKDDWSEEM